MKVEKILCDIRGCELEASFRIIHNRIVDLDRRFDTYGTRRLEVDLCLPHAEVFTITGTGSWAAPEPLKQPLR